MSKYGNITGNIDHAGDTHINAGSIGHLGNNYYGVSDFSLNKVHLLHKELEKLKAVSSLPSSKKQDLSLSIAEIDAALGTPTQSSLKKAFDKLSPGLRSLLSSIGANVASDALVAACKQALEHVQHLLY